VAAILNDIVWNPRTRWSRCPCGLVTAYSTNNQRWTYSSINISPACPWHTRRNVLWHSRQIKTRD